MRLERSLCTVLLNRLYDRGDTVLSVEHPGEDIGELVRIELGKHDGCTVHFTHDRDGYANARTTVARSYGDRVADDLPSPQDYINAFVAAGILDVSNRDEIEQFLDRYGDPNLLDGHKPVMAIFDTNLIPWRLDETLGLRHPEAGLGYVNGFVLPTGIRDELDWDVKCDDTRPFVEAFGEEFEAYWNQPLGAVRVGRLGLEQYRSIRDIQQADEIVSETGDKEIIAALDEYQSERRREVLLFSNDRNIVERSRSHRMPAQRVDLPDDVPKSATATWSEVGNLLFQLAVQFGILTLPAVTLFGVWSGKEGIDWQRERIRLDCRSPTIKEQLAGDLNIIETFNELRTSAVTHD